jgi:hypothetical protein
MSEIISFTVEEIYPCSATESQEAIWTLDDLLQTEEHPSEMMAQSIHYSDNYTVKELLLICEYYGFAKDLKTNKYTKEEIVDYLVCFEFDNQNTNIVNRRKTMWHYIDELRRDKFMKKFVLWL